MSQEILSAINMPLRVGDLVVSASSKNGFQEVTKGIVTKIDYFGYKCSVLGLKGDCYIYGSLSKNSDHEVRTRSIYGRVLVQIPPQLANQDKDFIALFQSFKYQKLINGT